MSLELPIVVRLDRTNAEEGRRILADAAPPNLRVSPTMLEAAKAAVRFATRPSDAWSDRAQAYVESDAHREGADLDLQVAWATGAGSTGLDVATGGGHVARRLREAGSRSSRAITQACAPTSPAARSRCPSRTERSTSSPAVRQPITSRTSALPSARWRASASTVC